MFSATLSKEIRTIKSTCKILTKFMSTANQNFRFLFLGILHKILRQLQGIERKDNILWVQVVFPLLHFSGQKFLIRFWFWFRLDFRFRRRKIWARFSSCVWLRVELKHCGRQSAIGGRPSLLQNSILQKRLLPMDALFNRNVGTSLRRSLPSMKNFRPMQEIALDASTLTVKEHCKEIDLKWKKLILSKC